MRRRAKRTGCLPSEFHLETLEKRILFSADTAFTALDAFPEVTSELVVLKPAEFSETVAVSTDQTGELVNELVIMDSTLPDKEKLLDDLARAGWQDTQVVVLDAKVDALMQISQVLAEQRELMAVHVISHGSSGELVLGGQRIDTLDLLSRADELAKWRNAFTSDADIRLYGYDVTAHGSGQDALDTITRLTGAAVRSYSDISVAIDNSADSSSDDRRGDILDNTVASAAEPSTYGNTLNDLDRMQPFYASDGTTDVNEQLLGRKEFLFISADIADYQELLDGIGSDVQVHVLDPERDGVEQIAQVLQYRTGVDAIHLVGEGSAAQMTLGASFLNQHSIDTDYATLFRRIGSSLSGDADLLIYGCNFGEGDVGHAAIQSLAALTGADVAASDDRTGHGSEFADWNLEAQTGAIETAVFVGRSAQAAWEHALATYTVTNTNDSGAGSLRQAIQDANTNAGTDSITFNIPGSGTQIINISSTLTITDTVVIDGVTQAGWAAGSFIPVVLDANDGNYIGLRLTSTADGSTINGLVIRDVAATSAGLYIDPGSDSNSITGNFIGSFNSDGTVAIGEELVGASIVDNGNSNTIGGTTTAERNVLAGAANGIVTFGATNGTISGNYIGTDATGNIAIDTTFDGIRLESGTTGVTIGGSSAGSGNLIAGVGSQGIEIRDEASDGNSLINNSIGLLADGTTVSGVGDSGIVIGAGADNTTIGGVGVGNTVVGSERHGVEIDGASTGTTIYGNRIGVNASGTVAAGNGLSGILLENGASNNTIGGIVAGQGNLVTGSGIISATDNSGITLLSNAGNGNSIAGNSMYSNAGIGIDLDGDGVTLNDAGDGDSGPNSLQNWAILDSASIADDGTFGYVLDTTTLATGTYTVDFYASTDRDRGQVEGERYLGRLTGVANGNSALTGTLSGITLAVGDYVTLVTTNASGNSSEFSDYAVAADSDAGGSTPSDLEAVATSYGGLSINEDGGDNVYLEADDGAVILTGLTSLTLEFQFSGQPVANGTSQSLLTYATPTNDSALGVFAYKSADGLTQGIGLDIDGTWYFAATNLDTMFDGNLHALSVAWSNSSGAVQIYSNGALIANETGWATGQSIDSGGRLVIGQDNDTSLYHFVSDNAFKGTMHDVRIFNDVRTSAEIAASYRSVLPFDEAGMVANWRFDRLSKDGVVTDAVSNNNLEIKHVIHGDFTASDASPGLRVAENALVGTVVGSVAGFDADREAIIAQLLANDPHLRYSAEADKFYGVKLGNYIWSVALADASNPGIPESVLNGATGQLGTIRSAAEQAIVAELAATFNIEMHMAGTDQDIEGQWRWYGSGVAEDMFWSGDVSGSSVDGSYSNFDAGEPNNLSDDDYLIVSPDGYWNDVDAAVGASYLVEWDADTVLDATDALTYSISSQTVAGAFAIDSDTGVISVANGRLLDYETQASHTLTVRVTDATGNFYDEAFVVALDDLVESNNVPSKISSGIELNTDGGNDAYLQAADGGAVLGGASEFTLEMSFATQSTAPQYLVSYAGSGAPNDLLFVLNNDGTATVTIDEIDTTVSGIDYSSLRDGSMHHLALSWDNSNGDWSIYVDGVKTDSGTGVSVGGTLDGSSGVSSLVFGQGQGSVGGVFDASQVFTGTLYDVRIWNQVRSEDEIALNYQHKFDSSSLPDGLIANWQMDGFNISNEVVDVVSGNNLITGNVSYTLINNWADQNGGASFSGNTVTFVDEGQSGWDSEVNSAMFSSFGFTDDYTVSFKLDNLTNFGVVIGLGASESGGNFSDVDYSMYFDHNLPGKIASYKEGAATGTFNVGYVAGDIFSFYINGTSIEYQHNGVTFYTATGVTPATDLYVDSAFYAAGGSYVNQDDYTLSDFRIRSGNGATPADNGATPAGFVSSTPVEDLHVSENAIYGAGVGFVVASDPDVSDDIVVDGQFLEASNPGSYATYSSGQSFGNWIVTSGDVDLIGTSFQSPSDGGRSIDLNGTASGTISQNLTTIPGQQYQLVFSLSGNWTNSSDNKDMRVTAAGQSKDFSIERPGGWATNNMLWSDRSMIFTGNATTSTLSFSGLDGNMEGATIGNIRVIEIPSAITTILNNDSTLSYDAATGKFYRFVNSLDGFDASLTAANGSTLNAVSGQLVTIGSAYENNLIQQVALDSGNSLWIGARDTNNDGNWNWLQGNAESDEQFWTGGSGGSAATGFYAPAFGQSESAGEDYVRMNNDGTWADDIQGSTHAYVIEWDASEVLSNFTYSLSNDAGGRFAIDGNTGGITVADNSLIDYELATSHDVTVEVTDSSGNTLSEVVTVAVDNAPDPAQTVPGVQSLNEDGPPLSFSAPNAVTVSDTFSGTDVPMQVVLSVNDGVLNLSGLTGITIVDGAQGSSSITVSGQESAINAALEGMTFTPDSDFNGNVTFNVSTALAPDLEGHYTFEGSNADDQSAGTIQDGTLNGDAATVFNATRNGDVLTLDGTRDSVQISGMFGNSADVTLAAWVNLNSGGDNDIISLGDNIAIRSEDGNLAALYYDSVGLNYLVTSTSISGGWHHVAAAFSSTDNTLRVYLDGLEVDSFSSGSSIVYARGTDTFIGERGDGVVADDYDGLVDDARIYTRALSVDEIAALAADNAESSDSVSITVNAVNDAPVFSNLDNNPTFVEDGAAVVLDADVAITDAELGGADNFSGATLTLVRDGGADTEDVYTATGNLGALTEGGSLVVGGTTIGTVISNSGGTLLLTFNGNASNTLVNSAMQQVAYSNSNDEPPSSVQIEWTFNDGNSSAQGSGGALTANGNTTVSVTAFNDAPLVGTNTGATVVEGGSVTITTAMLNEADVDDAGAGLTYSISSGPTNGQFELIANAGVSVASFTQDDIDNNRVIFVHDGTQAGADSIDFSLADGGEDSATPATGTFTFTVTNVNDAPEVANLTGDTLAYTEGDGQQAIDQLADAVVSDVDSSEFDTGTLTVSFIAGNDNAEDVLSIIHTGTGAGQIGVSGSNVTYAGTTIGTFTGGAGGTDLVITLNTNADAAAVSELTQQISYENTDTDNPSTGNRTVRYVLTDGDGGTSANYDTTISVTAVNDAPTNVGTLPAVITVSEDVSSDVDLSAIDVADEDAGSSSLTLTLSTSSGGNLSAAAGTGITIGGSGSGSVTLSGSVTDLNAYLNTIGNVTYLHGMANTFGTAADTLTVVVNDNGNTGSGGGTDQNLGTANIDITALNDAPLVGTNTGATVVEGGSVTITTAMLNEADVDDAGAGLTYSISSGPTNGQFELIANAGVSVASFTQDDIDNNRVIFVHDGTQAGADSIDFSLADGGEDSATPATGTFTFTVTNVNDAPEVANLTGDTLAYTEGDGQQAIDQLADAVVSDVDSSEFDTGTLTVSFIAGNDNAEDVLSIIHTGTGAGQIGVSGSNVTYAGTTIGTFTGGAGGTDLVITLNTNADAAAVSELTQQISYENTDTDNPSTGNRTVRYVLTDGDGGTSANYDTTISVTAVNDAPTNVGTLPAVITVSEDVSSDVDLSAIDVADVDAGSSSLTLTLSTSSGGNLSAAAGTGITIGGSGSGSVTLSGSVTDLNAYLNTIGNVTYLHGMANTFGTAADTLTVVVNDNGNTGSGGGTDQNLGTANIDITALNDAPLVGTNTGATVVEGGSVTITTAMLNEADVDDAGAGLTYSISSGPTNGQFELIANAGVSVASFTQDDIDNNRVIFVHDGTQAGADSIDFSLADGGEDSATPATGTFTFTVTNVNDAPEVANLTGDTLAYTEGDGQQAIDQLADAVVSDVDSSEFDTGTLTVSFIAGNDNAEDVLSIIHTGTGAGQIGVSGSNVTYAGTTIGTFTGGAGGTDLVITLNTNADAAAVSELTQQISYENTDTDNPSTGNRTVRYVLTDGDGGTSANYDTTISVTAVNDAPTNVGTLPAVITVSEDVSSDVDLSAIDVADVDAGSSSLTLTLSTSSGGNLSAAAGTGITIGGSGSGSVTLSGSVTDLNAYLNTIGNVTYLHGMANTFGTAADTLTVVVNDNGNTGSGGGTDQNLGTANIDITALNDAPLVGTNTGATVVEGGSVTITTAMLNEADVDDAGAGLTYSISSGPTNGQFELIANAGVSVASFTQDDIDNNRVIFVHDGTQAGADSIDFSLADGGEDSATPATGTFTFTVTNVNDAPEVANLTGDTLAYTEGDGQQAIDQLADAVVSDVDSSEFDTGTLTVSFIAGNDNAEDVLSIIHTGTGAGQIGVSGSNVTYAGTTIGTFTGGAGGTDLVITLNTNADAAAVSELTQQISYENTDTDNPSTGNRTVRYVLTDGDGGTSANYDTTISVTAVNDAPSLTATAGNPAFTEGGSAVSVYSGASASAIESGQTLESVVLTVTNVTDGTHEFMGADGSSFTLTNGTSGSTAGNGYGYTVSLVGSTATVSFTTAAAVTGSIESLVDGLTYHNTSDDPTTTSRVVTITSIKDSGGTANSGADTSSIALASTVTLSVTNDAPVLDSSGDLRLPTITEDEVNNSGLSVAQILASDGGAPISDVDSGSVEGIAITTRNNGRGIWEYSTDAGASWVVVGTVSESDALLLRATDLVRFAPNGDNGTTTDRSFEFRAWDQTSGVAGTNVDATIHGGATAFSTDIESAFITATDINDAPILDNSGTATLTTQAEDAGAPSGALGTVITDLVQIGSNVSDVDASSQTGIAITAVDSTNGKWWYTTDGGTNWNAMGSVSDSSARVLNANSGTRIYFQSDTEFNGTVTNAITFRAWDRSIGSNGSLQDASTAGGISAFSVNTETANQTVISTNDAPRLLGLSIVTNGMLTTDLTGWSANGNVDNDGTQARFGQIGGVNGTLSQSFTTEVGQNYIVSFDYRDGSATKSQSLNVDIVGVSPLVSASIDSGIPENSLQTYRYAFVADSTSATITFTDTSSDHGGVRGYLDNVSVATDAQPNVDLVYTENAGAFPVDTTIDIVDTDDTHIESAVVQITANFISGKDLLSFVNQNGISGMFNSTNGALTLTGSATVTDYEAAIRSITYTNTSEIPGINTRTISVSVNDGDTNSNTQTRDIVIISVNDNPVNAGSFPSDIVVTEGVLTTVDLSAIELSDADAAGGDLLATLSTSTGGNLSAAAGTGITIGGSGSGSVTLSGSVTDLNAYLNTIGNVTYLHGMANTFGTAADTLTVVVNDNGNTGSGGGTDQNLGTANIDITALNDAPLVGTNTGATVVEGGSVTITTAMLNEADVDDAGAGLTYSISSGPTNGQFELIANAGVSVASFTQDDIDNNRVIFVHDGTQAGADSIDFSLADGGEDSATPATGTFTFTVTNVNDAPEVANLTGDTPAYTEGDGQQAIDQLADAVVSDVDSSEFDTGTLTVSFIAGNDNAEDVLSIIHTGTGAGQIGVSGSNVTYAGTTIGTFTGGAGGTDLVITLNTNADAAAVSELTQQISYENTDTDNPSTGNRTVRYVLTDGDGGTSANYDTTISVTAVNDAPTNVGTLPAVITVSEDVSSDVDLSAIDVADEDAGSSSLTLTLSTSSGGNLSAAAGTGITIGGSGSGSVTLSGSVTDLNAYLNTIGNVTYLHGMANTFGTAADTLTVVVNDNGNTGSGGGTDQNLGTANIDITALNDAPLVGTNTGATVVEGGSVTITTAMLNEADVDDAGAGLTYSISSGPTNGQFELIANAGVSVASFTQDDIDNNRVIFVHDGTQAGADSIDFSLADGGEDSATPATGTFTFTVTNVNDAPEVANLTGDTLAYTEGDGQQAIDQLADAVVSDVDSSEFDTGTLTVSFIAGNDNAEDVLSIIHTGTGAGQIGVSGSNVTYAGTTIGTFTGGAGGTDLVITLNTNADAAAVSELTQQISYENTDTDNPSTGNRTVRYVLTDGDGGTSANYDTTISVTAVNDAPTNVGTLPAVITVSEDVSSDVDLSAIDVADVDAGSSSLTLTLSTSSGGNLSAAAGTGITIGGSGSGSVTLSGSVTDLNAYLNTIGNVTYLHGMANTFGTAADTLTVVVNDNGNTGSGGGTDQNLGTANIDISATNDMPTRIMITGNSIAEDTDTNAGTIIGTLSTLDADTREMFTYSVVGGADTAVFSIGGTSLDELILTDGALDFESKQSYSVTIRTTDSGGLMYDQAFVILVTDVNDDPVITSSASTSVAENQTTVLTVATSDVDGGAPVYSIAGGADASAFSIDEFSGVLTFRTAPNFEMPVDTGTDNIYNVTVQVADGNGGTASQAISVAVVNINEAPVIDSGGGNAGDGGNTQHSISVDENLTMVTVISATDVDANSSQTYSLSGGEDQTAFSIDAGTGALAFVSLPDHEVKESYEVEVTVTDSGGLAATLTLLIYVQDVNEPPSAQIDMLEVAENSLLIIDPLSALLSNDSDPEDETLTLVSFSQPQNGVLLLNAQGMLEYVPATGFIGLDSFVYEIEDSVGNRVNAHVHLDVQELNDNPSDPDDLILAAAQREKIGNRMAQLMHPGQASLPQASIFTAATAANEQTTAVSLTLTPGELQRVLERTGAGSVRVENFNVIPTRLETAKAMDSSVIVRISSDSELLFASSLLQLLLDHGISDINSSVNLNDQLRSEDIYNAIKLLREQIDRMVESSTPADTIATWSPIIVGGSITVGILTWLLNSGLMISATLSASPLWRPLDPIPILVHADDDVEQLDKAEATGDSGHQSVAANDSANLDIKHG